MKHFYIPKPNVSRTWESKFKEQEDRNDYDSQNGLFGKYDQRNITQIQTFSYKIININLDSNY